MQVVVVGNRPHSSRKAAVGWRLLDVKKLPNAAHVDMNQIDRIRSWVIVTAVWKENLKDDSPIHSADAKATALTVLTHSAGAARVGAILALVAMLFFVFVGGLHPTCSTKAWATIVGLGFVCFISGTTFSSES